MFAQKSNKCFGPHEGRDLLKRYAYDDILRVLSVSGPNTQAVAKGGSEYGIQWHEAPARLRKKTAARALCFLAL